MRPPADSSLKRSRSATSSRSRAASVSSRSSDGDVVLYLLEDGGEVFDADPADELAQLFVLDEPEHLAHEIGGEAVE
jgi:hypothetical protein